ncbi:MAG: hypothetical protein NXI32_01095 [bacterium]|nr:hypothetical protein [bacterium]
MRSFHFNLSAILQQRKQNLDRIRSHYQAALTKVEATDIQIRELREELSGLRYLPSPQPAVTQEIDLVALQAQSSYQDFLRERLAKLICEREQLQAYADEQQRQMRDATQEHHSLVSLRSAKHAQWCREYQKSQQRQLDEIASTKSNRQERSSVRTQNLPAAWISQTL